MKADIVLNIKTEIDLSIESALSIDKSFIIKKHIWDNDRPICGLIKA